MGAYAKRDQDPAGATGLPLIDAFQARTHATQDWRQYAASLFLISLFCAVLPSLDPVH